MQGDRTICSHCYEVDNCMLLCNLPCHDRLEKDKKGEYKEIMINRLGQKRYDTLETQANTYKKKDDKMNEIIINQLLKEINET